MRRGEWLLLVLVILVVALGAGFVVPTILDRTAGDLAHETRSVGQCIAYGDDPTWQQCADTVASGRGALP